MRKFYALFLLSFFIVSTYAQDRDKAAYTSTDNGKWEDGTTWVGGVSPGNTVGALDVVTINHTVQVGQAVSYAISCSGTINIATGGLLEVGYAAIPFPPPPTVWDATLTMNSGSFLQLTGGTLRIATGLGVSSSLLVSNGSELTYTSGTFTNSSEITFNGIYNHTIDGGVIPPNMTWNQTTSELKLSGLSSVLPTMPSDDLHNLKIDCGSMSADISFNNAFVSLFDNVEIAETNGHYITGHSGNLVTYSGNLTIQANGKFKVNKNDRITVVGTLSNTSNSNLIIKSESGNTGSLISGSSPNGTMECYVSSGQWHLIGPPNSTLSASPTFLTGYMQTWADGNPNGTWTVHEDNPALTRGEGAAYYFYSNFTADFTGALMGSAVTVSALGNAGGGDDGWHLLANPFPCSLDLGNCTHTGISSTFYVYNGSSYVTPENGDDGWSNDDVIATSQGFFAQVGSGSRSFVFNTNAKVHNNDNIQKTKDLQDIVRFTLTDDINMSNDALVVQFYENATIDYDLEYDGHKLIGSPTAGEIMAQITTEEFAAVLGLPFSNTTTTVVVNFKKGDASEYTLELKNNYLENMEITLEDTQTGFTTDLSANPVYVFTADESTDGRFLLHFKDATSVSELTENDDVKIWNYKDVIYLQQDNPENGELFIYNISGQLIKSQLTNASALQKVELQEANGTYLIKFVTDNNSYSQKIIK